MAGLLVFAFDLGLLGWENFKQNEEISLCNSLLFIAVVFASGALGWRGGRLSRMLRLLLIVSVGYFVTWFVFKAARPALAANAAHP
jgi:hypothetical protein